MTKEQENYIKALHDIKKAKESFEKLTDIQKDMLIKEVLGVELAMKLGYL